MASEDKANDKSRRERRKEARLEKNKKKFNSWVQHQQSRKSVKSLLVSEPKDTGRSQKDSKKARLMNSDDEDMYDELESEVEQNPTKENTETEINGPKRRDASVKKTKTKFKEYLEMEMKGDLLSSKEDLRLEKKLAKKLKVKGGRVPGMEDDIGELLEGIPSALDFLEEGKDIVTDVPKEAPSKKRKKTKMENEEDDNPNDNGVAEDSYEEYGESDSYDDEDQDNEEDVVLAKKPKKINSKRTKFEEYLEAEMQKGGVSAAEDLAWERKLAKKLKVKKGGLSGDDDAVNELLEGIPSVTGQSEESKLKINEASVDEEKMRVKAPADPNVSCSTKYIAPHLRRNDSDDHAQIRKQLRGLLNRLSESNVESVTGQISTMFRSVGRSVGSQLIGQEVLAFCCGGPRGNEQYAAVFAAFVAGMACSVGVDFGANLLSSVAKSFEDEYAKEDNLSLRNLTLLLSYLYKFGVCSSDLIYDFMITLSKRLTEVDVSTILTVLQSCGMRLRSDDPVGMKNFILSVQSRVNELKASEEGQSNISSKRMEFMLETICDIKNNKTRSKEDNVQQTRIKKWLQKLRVDDILIRGLNWSKLLDPEKKGQWWLSGDNLSNSDHVEEVASRTDMDVPETQKMLQLAAAQRMNTDARRAIFCVIMSGEDYIDAFEKLLRLDLPGKQDREIIRVLVDCCLQERVFNKYYCVLASKLCSHDKNHKFTLQYCLWDRFKNLESMELVRSLHLAKFVAEMVASFSLSLAVLKVVDFCDVAQLTPKRIMHFRMLFEAILEFPEKIIWNIFTRIAVTPEYESLRTGVEFFVTEYVISGQKSLKSKFRVARKAFNNVEGVLM
ncbi:hypothetical protein Leryth_008809 [Lithospermum erythrorhizon]|nr:hypothetical protein Leryth_008809 [Lithospermum erythrorhizon]